MSKTYHWKHFTIQVTKKKIKNTNLSIKPAQPDVICMSIPYAMSYNDALEVLEQPRIQRWVEKHQKKLQEHPEYPKVQEMERYHKRLQKILPELFKKWESRLGVRCAKYPFEIHVPSGEVVVSVLEISQLVSGLVHILWNVLNMWSYMSWLICWKQGIIRDFMRFLITIIHHGSIVGNS